MPDIATITPTPAAALKDTPPVSPQQPRLLDRVRDLMRDGRWRTLAEIVELCGGSEAGVSARLRDLRKPQHGGRRVERRRRGEPRLGLWEYRLEEPA